MSLAIATVGVFVFFIIFFFVTREAIRSACRSEFRSAQWADECIARNADRLTTIDRRSGLDRRRGVAAVEMAIVLPLFVLLFLGMIELGRGFIVQQVITNAVREGAHYAASDPAPSVAQVQSLVQQYLTLSRLPSATISVSEKSDSIGGKAETVTVTLPFKSVSWLPVPKYLAGIDLAASATFAKQAVK